MTVKTGIHFITYNIYIVNVEFFLYNLILVVYLHTNIYEKLIKFHEIILLFIPVYTKINQRHV